MNLQNSPSEVITKRNKKKEKSTLVQVPEGIESTAGSGKRIQEAFPFILG